MQKGFAPIIILVGILVLASVGGIYFLKIKIPVQKTCTQEAKVCPDGTSIGRVGPNCEFASCPLVLPSPTPNFTCPENGWEDCMPTVIEDGQKDTRQCSQEALDWKKKNCSNFQGAAY